MPVTRLFEITAQYRALLALEDSDDLPPEVIADTLEGLEGDFKAKAEAVAKFILSLEASAEAITAAAERQAARAGRLARRAESIRQYLLLQFQVVDFKKIETDDLVIARRNNPPAVCVVDEARVPAGYWVQPEPPPKHLDRKAIGDALKTGAAVEGCYLQVGERLDIRL
jgi:hypothetical protein